MIFNEERLFQRYQFRQRGTFVDVGANNGVFVDPFAKRGWDVVAFEPHPALFVSLAERYSNRANVRCFQHAISDKSGELPFYTSEDHPGIHSLAAFHPTHKPSHIVKVSTLGAELERLEVTQVAALKIDVEGADFLALRGFDFDRFRPELVMVEFMDDRSLQYFGYDHHSMAQFMMARGYEVWVSEWAPLIEYGKADGGTPHAWVGFHAYEAESTPAHGNLLFVQAGDCQQLKRAVRRTLREIKAKDTIRAVPGVRSTVRMVRRLRS